MAATSPQSATTGPGALPGLDAHEHARAILTGALARGHVAHAYLFHGPAGTGKRSAARAFAAALLAGGSAREDDTALSGRVERGTHPDLTWVRPTGAAEMLVGDVDEAVVGGASRTPFEAAKRVFVIESAEQLNDEAANRLLKTLEEPPAWAHLLLIARDRDAVLPTVASRCQDVRFDPLPPALVARSLEEAGVAGAEALACARLALGDASLARVLAAERGREARADAEGLVGAAVAGELARRPWLALLARAREHGKEAAESVREHAAQQRELLGEPAGRGRAREIEEAGRRAERRARACTLDLALRMTELWLRDAWCLAEGAATALHAVDRISSLQALLALAGPGAASRMRKSVELVAETRLRLKLNVSEELALEALAYRLAGTLTG